MSTFDKIKSAIAIILLSLIFGSFIIYGKEHVITRYTAATGMILWVLIVIYTKWVKNRNKPS